MVGELTPTEFEARRKAGNNAILLDVREEWELAVASIPASTAGAAGSAGSAEPAAGPAIVHVPMGEIAQRIGELDPRRETVVMCRSGRRSLEVARYLQRSGFQSVSNLTGGILAWSRELDPSIPEY